MYIKYSLGSIFNFESHQVNLHAISPPLKPLCFKSELWTICLCSIWWKLYVDINFTVFSHHSSLWGSSSVVPGILATVALWPVGNTHFTADVSAGNETKRWNTEAAGNELFSTLQRHTARFLTLLGSERLLQQIAALMALKSTPVSHQPQLHQSAVACCTTLCDLNTHKLFLY